MTIGFFTVFRADPQHQLHATLLVRQAQRLMPDVEIVQFTDRDSPVVTGVNRVSRLANGPMLERRLEHYAACQGDWLLMDTDVSIRQDVRAVFDDATFDVALTDRLWPHLPQTDEVMRTMPFNTGVVFTRSPGFWAAVLETWRALPEPRDWLSEQVAVAAVVKAGQFRVKVLLGMTFNYPPDSETDPCDGAALVHFKGRRKQWLTRLAYRDLTEAACA